MTQHFFIKNYNGTAFLGFVICFIQGILVTVSQQSSPVIVKESNTARFSWQIPAGESFVTIYVVSPSGSAVLFANAANQNQTGSNYRSRVTYTGDLSVRTMAFDLRDVVRSDAGTYMCGRNEPNVVIDDCGQKLIVLGLPTKPKLQGQSTPVLGSQMTLTCSSSSTTLPADHGLTLTYSWQRDNSDITVTPPGSSYTFTVASRGIHSYRCRATASQDLQSQWSSEYLLQPEYSPYNVSLQPPARSYTKTEDEESVPSITCFAGCKPGCTYSWYKDGTVFTSGATLNLGLANRTQTGSYQCRATNKHGTEQGQNVSVDITYASITSLTINSMSDTVTVSEQDTVTLRCQVDSKPTSTVRLLNGTQELNRNHSLTVQHSWEVNCRQRGNYSCTANNDIGTDVTKTVKLAVNCFPRADRSQQFQFSAQRGGNVTLWVSVLAYPTPSYTWNRTNSSSQDLSGSLEHVSDISSNISLTLNNLQQQDFGQYNLIVANGIQTPDLFSVTVVPEGPPETPTDVTVTAESSTSLSVSWKRGFSGGAHQTFTVEYTQDNITLHRTGRVEETSDKEYYSLIVSNLHPSTLYFLRVYAENKFGNSSYTEIQTVVTEMQSEVPNSDAALIAGVVIGMLAVLTVIGVLGFIFWRKRGPRAKNDESNGLKNLHRDTLVQPNVAHAGSDEPIVDEYAVVHKKKKPSSQARPTDVYAKVDVKNKNKKERGKKKHRGAKHDQQETEGNPYMNHGFDKGNNASVQTQKSPPTGRDENGCKYIDVEIIDAKPQMRPPKADSAPVEYSSIQIGVVGPQLVEEDEG